VKRVTIKTDTFDIAKRLKQIDNNYIIKYNLTKKRYEVFYKESKEEVLQLVLPYKELDERTINLVNKTRVENLKTLMEELEKQNEKQIKQIKDEQKDQTNIQINEMTKYILKKGDNYNLDFSNSYKTKWV
jgi:hypothetical protein